MQDPWNTYTYCAWEHGFKGKKMLKQAVMLPVIVGEPFIVSYAKVNIAIKLTLMEHNIGYLKFRSQKPII